MILSQSLPVFLISSLSPFLLLCVFPSCPSSCYAFGNDIARSIPTHRCISSIGRFCFVKQQFNQCLLFPAHGLDQDLQLPSLVGREADGCRNQLSFPSMTQTVSQSWQNIKKEWVLGKLQDVGLLSVSDSTKLLPFTKKKSIYQCFLSSFSWDSCLKLLSVSNVLGFDIFNPHLKTNVIKSLLLVKRKLNKTITFDWGFSLHLAELQSQLSKLWLLQDPVLLHYVHNQMLYDCSSETFVIIH